MLVQLSCHSQTVQGHAWEPLGMQDLRRRGIKGEESLLRICLEVNGCCKTIIIEWSSSRKSLESNNNNLNAKCVVSYSLCIVHSEECILSVFHPEDKCLHHESRKKHLKLNNWASLCFHVEQEDWYSLKKREEEIFPRKTYLPTTRVFRWCR